MNSKQFLSKYWIWIILVLIFVLYSHFLFSDPLLLWDESVYLGNARGHLETSYFQEDFRFPLLEYVISGVWFITGESVLVAHLIMIVLSLLGVFGMFLLSKFYFKKTVWQALTTITFALTPVIIFWSFRVYTDIPAMSMMIFSIYFFLRYLEKKNNCLITISGIFVSLAFLFKFSFVLFVFPLLLSLLLRKEWKSLVFFSLGGIIPLIPWLPYNSLMYKNPLWDLMAQGEVISMYTSWQPVHKLLLFILKNTYFLLIGFIVGIVHSIKQFKELKYQILLTTTSLIILFHLFIVQLKLERYILAFLPFMILLSMIGFSKLETKIPKNIKKIVTTVFLILIVLTSIFFVYQNEKKINKEEFCNQAMKESIIFVQENVPEGELVASNHWTWYGFYGNHRLSSTWTKNISLIIEKNDPALFVINRWSGLPMNLNDFDTHESLNKEAFFKDSCNQEIYIYSVK